MSNIAVRTDGAPLPLARYSQAVKAGNTLYLQGVIALDPATGKLAGNGIKEQSERVFQSIEAILEEAGMKPAHVVKVTAFLSDLADYPGFNEVYNAFFASDPPPARTTVQAKLPLGALLEVEAVAWKE